MPPEPKVSNDRTVSRRAYLIYRHPAAIRITHWINAVCLVVLLMSGLQIFNAHPALYFGKQSDFERPFLALRAEKQSGQIRGVTSVLGARIDTTGIFGASKNDDGVLTPRGFPAWITLPSWQDLATGRRWHFFFAWIFLLNGLIYVLYSWLSGHTWRDLLPTRDQLRHVGQSIWDHLRLRFPEGEEAKHYNVLQRLSYLAVIFLVLPVTVAAGLTMSPGLDAAFPWLLDIFGGRQSARSIHFIGASLIVLFAFVHVFMVLVSGVFNNLRSMITGYYAIRSGGPRDQV